MSRDHNNFRPAGRAVHASGAPGNSPRAVLPGGLPLGAQKQAKQHFTTAVVNIDPARVTSMESLGVAEQHFSTTVENLDPSPNSILQRPLQTLMSGGKPMTKIWNETGWIVVPLTQAHIAESMERHSSHCMTADWSIRRGSFCRGEHQGHAGRASASLPINRITAELWCHYHAQRLNARINVRIAPKSTKVLRCRQ